MAKFKVGDRVKVIGTKEQLYMDGIHSRISGTTGIVTGADEDQAAKDETLCYTVKLDGGMGDWWMSACNLALESETGIPSTILPPTNAD